jgi:hypothetical protein
MRNHYLVAVAVVAAIASVATTPATVQAQDYPFCIKGEFWPNTVGDCRFQTYQQCLATASGGASFCDANPFFNDRSQAGAVDSRKRSSGPY